MAGRHPALPLPDCPHVPAEGCVFVVPGRMVCCRTVSSRGKDVRRSLRAVSLRRAPSNQPAGDGDFVLRENLAPELAPDTKRAGLGT